MTRRPFDPQQRDATRSPGVFCQELAYRARGFNRRVALPLFLVAATILSGCHPIQPFYFHEDGDLSHYLDHATQLEYPDVESSYLPEVENSLAPYKISRPEDLEPWDLTLEDVISITLKNSKVVLSAGTVGQLVSNQVAGAGLVSTVYDPAIIESDPDTGVEAALSAFDAQINILGTSNGNFVNSQDRPTTFSFGGGANVIQQTAGGIRAELAKRSAGGTQYFVRGITEYTRGNTFGGLNQAIDSIWQQSLEVEARQPILRGRGALVNRVPVILARINTDISLANFEANVRSLVLDVEKAYWDLYNAYRTLDANRTERDAAQKLWKVTWERFDQGVAGALEKAQADQQYFDFRARLEDSLRALYATEANLRLLMGLAPTDGRIIRPIDEPTIAAVEFDWRAVHHESLIRSPELRQQKWRVESHETQLIAAKNQLLPQFDLGATYRWFGIGDNLINADRNGLDFPALGSTAWDVLTEGDFQESAFFLQFQMPVGYRRELARVRNVQLQIVRERARLEQMELVVVHQLTTNLQNLDAFHQLAKTRFNHWKSANDEYKVAEALFLGGRGPEGTRTALEPVLDAQRRRSEAQREYYRVVSEYNKAIADVHFRKGSLLEYNNIYLEEGPWPEKAYWDALGLARERDASYYLDYGWTRPGVISQGPIEQQGGNGMFHEMTEEHLPGVTDGEPTEAKRLNELPGDLEDSMPMPAPRPGPITSRPDEPSLNAPIHRADATEPAVKAASFESFDWGGLSSEQVTPIPATANVAPDSPSRREGNPLR
jgi:outer membrane protein TolC